MVLCGFCGEEDAIVGVTEANYPAGEKCWGKIVAKGVEWDEKGLKLEQIKRLAGIRKARTHGFQ